MVELKVLLDWTAVVVVVELGIAVDVVAVVEVVIGFVVVVVVETSAVKVARKLYGPGGE